MPAGLDRGHVEARRLHEDGRHVLAEHRAPGCLHRGVAAAVQHQAGLGAEQPARVHAQGERPRPSAAPYASTNCAASSSDQRFRMISGFQSSARRHEPRSVAGASLPSKTALPVTITSTPRPAIMPILSLRDAAVDAEQDVAARGGDHLAHLRRCASSVAAMNFCPPQPGLTASSSTISTSSSSGSSALDRRAGIQRDAAHDGRAPASLAFFIGPAPATRGADARGVGVDRDDVGAGRDVVARSSRAARDHQVHVLQQRRPHAP